MTKEQAPSQSTTPETDAFVEMGRGLIYSEFVDFACKLERERNQWRDRWRKKAVELAVAGFNRLKGLAS